MITVHLSVNLHLRGEADYLRDQSSHYGNALSYLVPNEKRNRSLVLICNLDKLHPHAGQPDSTGCLPGSV